MNSQLQPVIAAFALLVCLALPVRSQPVITFDYRGMGGGFDGPDQVQGWEFIPKTSVTVLQLGMYEGRGLSSFNEPHVVAIWDSYNQIIASASSSQTGTVSGSFIFWNIEPIILFAEQIYVIGAFMPAPCSDYAALFTPEYQGTSIHVDPKIQFIAYRAGLSPGSISLPTGRWEEYFGAFGPNFVIARDPPPAPTIRSFIFDSTIVLRSSPATNTFSMIAEYKTNLNDSNWVALTTLSNRFLNGTSEMFCRRPPGTNLFIRLRLQ